MPSGPIWAANHKPIMPGQVGLTGRFCGGILVGGTSAKPHQEISTLAYRNKKSTIPHCLSLKTVEIHRLHRLLIFGNLPSPR